MNKHLHTRSECPLTLAAEKGYVELAQLLLSRSANVEARTKKGCSPFYLACKEGFKEIAVMLAKHGSSTEVSSCYWLECWLEIFMDEFVC